MSGPIHAFTLAEPYTGYSCKGDGCVAGAVMPLWGANLFMATGPGQTPGSANTDRPLAIALGIINNAIGSNTNLVAVTQSGTPTFKYPGGQKANGSPTILANPAVPYVNCFAYSNGQGSGTTICFNNNLNMPEFVTLAGPGAPTGNVTKTIFPKDASIVAHNEDSFLGAATKAPGVVPPAPSSASGSTYLHTSGILHRSQVFHRGAATLMPTTFSEDRRR